MGRIDCDAFALQVNRAFVEDLLPDLLPQIK